MTKDNNYQRYERHPSFDHTEQERVLLRPVAILAGDRKQIRSATVHNSGGINLVTEM